MPRSPDDSAAEVTICSVSFGSWPLLQRNWELTRTLNRSYDTPWLVVENAPQLNHEAPGDTSDRFQVIAGAPYEERYGGASYHHGAALNIAAQKSTTRFTLFIDPDFFVVRPAWIRSMRDHMVANELAIFGAPYHPRWFNKYRYRPCLHFAMFDFARIDRRLIDLRPDPIDMRGTALHDVARRTRRTRTVARSRLGVGALEVARNLYDRRNIGRQQDTGFRVKQLCAEHRFDTVTPVYRIADDYPAPPEVARISRAFDWVMPDRLSYQPKRHRYATPVGFRELGFADVARHGWEEYVWRGEPFACHGRAQGTNRTDVDAHLAEVRELLRISGAVREALG